MNGDDGDADGSCLGGCQLYGCVLPSRLYGASNGRLLGPHDEPLKPPVVRSPGLEDEERFLCEATSGNRAGRMHAARGRREAETWLAVMRVRSGRMAESVEIFCSHYRFIVVIT